MEYFIGVDKGPFEVIKSRFEIMNLENIRGSLVCKDNLRNLVKFTTMFKNEKELKAFLVKKGVLARIF